jgi:hypothetical protein
MENCDRQRSPTGKRSSSSKRRSKRRERASSSSKRSRSTKERRPASTSLVPPSRRIDCGDDPELFLEGSAVVSPPGRTFVMSDRSPSSILCKKRDCFERDESFASCSTSAQELEFLFWKSCRTDSSLNATGGSIRTPKKDPSAHSLEYSSSASCDPLLRERTAYDISTTPVDIAGVTRIGPDGRSLLKQNNSAISLKSNGGSSLPYHNMQSRIRGSTDESTTSSTYRSFQMVDHECNSSQHHRVSTNSSAAAAASRNTNPTSPPSMVDRRSVLIRHHSVATFHSSETPPYLLRNTTASSIRGLIVDVTNSNSSPLPDSPQQQQQQSRHRPDNPMALQLRQQQASERMLQATLSTTVGTSSTSCHSAWSSRSATPYSTPRRNPDHFPLAQQLPQQQQATERTWAGLSNMGSSCRSTWTSSRSLWSVSSNVNVAELQEDEEDDLSPISSSTSSVVVVVVVAAADENDKVQVQPLTTTTTTTTTITTKTTTVVTTTVQGGGNTKSLEEHHHEKGLVSAAAAPPPAWPQTALGRTENIACGCRRLRRARSQ